MYSVSCKLNYQTAQAATAVATQKGRTSLKNENSRGNTVSSAEVRKQYYWRINVICSTNFISTIRQSPYNHQKVHTLKGRVAWHPWAVTSLAGLLTKKITTVNHIKHSWTLIQSLLSKFSSGQWVFIVLKSGQWLINKFTKSESLSYEWTKLSHRRHRE